VRWTQIWLWK